jgi:hypothetical protein
MNDVFPTVEPDSDKAYRLVEAVASLVPAGTTLLQSIVTPPIQRRMEAWIDKVEERLLALHQAQRIDLDELTRREDFSALLLRTIHIAAATSQKEQLENLQNFAINVAVKPDISEDELYIILDVINNYTPSHVKVLKFYHDPLPYFTRIVEIRKYPKDERFQQGQDLAHAFEQGTPYYWQNVFYLVANKNVITNHKTVLNESSPDIYVNGRGTEIGSRVVAMLEKRDA